jgi:dolichyl-phosphate-mannose-protein mannosyltransferase
VIVAAMVITSWWFYPVWTAEVIPYEAWRMRMWFASWV